jgi:hypothetical protein
MPSERRPRRSATHYFPEAPQPEGTDHMSQYLPQPSTQQLAKMELAQADAAELINRQLEEGIDPAAILAGFATALADYQIRAFGPDRAAYWFYSNFRILAEQLHLNLARYTLQPPQDGPRG